MYLTYAQYQAWGGTLDSATFNDLEFQAEGQINWYTFNRLTAMSVLPDAVQRCMYSLINILALQAQAYTLGGASDGSVSSGAITSQSNDGVSVSYNALNARDVDAVASQKIKDLIQRSLAGVKNQLGQEVLYRGLYSNERYTEAAGND